MTAQEARNKTLWYRLDSIIKQYITEAVNHGLFFIIVYKSVNPSVYQKFVDQRHILHQLGYNLKNQEVELDGELDHQLILEWQYDNTKNI
jgi:hypothetical protein